MIAYASRYGHQPLLTQIGGLTLERLAAFNDAIQDLIRDENKSGTGITNSAAEGGG